MGGREVIRAPSGPTRGPADQQEVQEPDLQYSGTMAQRTVS